MIYDRAAVITATVLSIVASSAPKTELQRQVEDAIREEIAAIERKVAAERNLRDESNT
jgi:hypothetical protein